jgi:hypothetical protein
MVKRSADKELQADRTAKIECQVLAVIKELGGANALQIHERLPALTIGEVRAAIKRQFGICVQRKNGVGYCLTK